MAEQGHAIPKGRTLLLLSQPTGVFSLGAGKTNEIKRGDRGGTLTTSKYVV